MKINGRSDDTKLIYFSIFSATFFGLLTAHIAFSGRTLYNEMGPHLLVAKEMAASGKILVPHFIFHILVIGVHQIIMWIDPSFGILKSDPFVDNGWLTSGVIVVTAAYAGIALLLVKYLVGSSISSGMAMLLAFALMILTPIFLLAPFDGLYYLGYITPSTVYNIPTQTLLKLTTLALFMATPLIKKQEVSVGILGLLSVLVIANGLSKPNFLIIMLPALFTLVALRRMRHEYVNHAVIAAIFGVSVLVLAWQYYFKFENPDGRIYDSGITVTLPFEVMSHLSAYVVIKILLSIVFPVYVAVVFRKEIFQDTELIYAWLLFIFGMIFSIFLAETGSQRYSGNFLWSGEIGNFVIFVVSTRFFFFKGVTQNKALIARLNIGIIIFTFHVVCGLIYYVRSFTHAYR